MPMQKTLGLSAAALLALFAPTTACADRGDPHNGTFSIKDATKGVTGTGTLTAEIKIKIGDEKEEKISCELYEQDAPNTVANFVGLARGVRAFEDPSTSTWVKKPFYNGLIFHRVIPNFMIQGGDIRGTGSGEPGYTIADEKNAPHKFDRAGVLAMANRGPNTAGSQFFITERPTPMLDDGGPSGGHYQIFGQCDNVELVKRVARVPRTSNDRPHQDVKMTTVTILRTAASAAKPASK